MLGWTLRLRLIALLAPMVLASGCGYHTLGSAMHLSPDVRTLSIPVFATRSEAYHTEVVLTQAVVREFAGRTRLRVTPANDDSDATLQGTILQQTVAPLTYNTSTQQSSSFVITVVVSVTLKDRNGRLLYENKGYVFRHQYQSTTNLPTFLDESPAAEDRLARDFARNLVSDVLAAL